MTRLLAGAGTLLLLAAGALGVTREAPPPGELAVAAARFLDALGGELRARAAFAFDAPERTDWHYVPKERAGVALHQMDRAQRRAAHALLRAALSSQGYLKTTAIFELETVLRALEGAEYRDPERYWFAVFGAPGNAEPWAFRVEGHHVSLHFTSGAGLVAAAPAFLGANPAEVPSGPSAGLRVLGAEEDLGRALLQSLTDEQRHAAVLDGAAPLDIVFGPDRAAGFDERAGVAWGALDAGQRARLWRLIEEYALNLRADLAAHELDRIRAAGVERLRFLWIGAAGPGEGHYYRVSGPTFVVEYDNVQGGANHVHTVWRDPNGDFGADLLRRHREQHPHHADGDHR